MVSVPIGRKKTKLKVRATKNVQLVTIKATHEVFGDIEGYLVNTPNRTSNEEAAGVEVGPGGISAGASEKADIQGSNWTAIIQGDGLPLTIKSLDELDLDQLRADFATTASDSTGSSVSSSRIGDIVVYPKTIPISLSEAIRVGESSEARPPRVIIMVKCGGCGKEYSSGIVIEESSNVTLRGNQAQCPQCGRMNPIPDR